MLSSVVQLKLGSPPPYPNFSQGKRGSRKQFPFFKGPDPKIVVINSFYIPLVGALSHDQTWLESNLGNVAKNPAITPGVLLLKRRRKEWILEYT